MLTKHLSKILVALFVGAIGLMGSIAMAEVEVAGVKYADSVDIKGQKLMLNGAGIRTKAIFKVYTAGLYLPKPATTTELALAMQGTKSIRVTMLRDIDAQELGNLLVRGVEANSSKEEFFKFAVSFTRMGDIFNAQKKLRTGDTFSLDYIPGTGTIMTVKGAVQGEPFKEPEFFSALLKIWLGPKPADSSLKEALLGKKAAPVQSPQERY